MADESPPGSPLSMLSSDDFEAEEENERMVTMPPAKRQKIEGSPSRATPVSIQDDVVAGYISSDTDGDVPNTPSNGRPDEDDTHEQITVCAWEDCDAGDLGDNDKLVNHINNEHIENRTKKYTCEWVDCQRKSQTHASGYALKSHMRSHTREKPFICLLPECDRAFTRSDALAKHMRTVHDTEPLRPSDPIPKTQTAKQRLKIINHNKLAQPPVEHHASSNGVTNGQDAAGWTSSFPPELGFTVEEEARGAKELYRLLRRQIYWAEEEGTSLKQQCESIETLRKQEWIEKEVLLDKVIEGEIAYNCTREQVIAGSAALTADAIKRAASPVVQSIDEIVAAAAEPPPLGNGEDWIEPTMAKHWDLFRTPLFKNLARGIFELDDSIQPDQDNTKEVAEVAANSIRGRSLALERCIGIMNADGVIMPEYRYDYRTFMMLSGLARRRDVALLVGSLKQDRESPV